MESYKLNILHIFLYNLFLRDSCYIYTFMIFIDLAVFMYKNSYKFINMLG